MLAVSTETISSTREKKIESGWEDELTEKKRILRESEQNESHKFPLTASASSSQRSSFQEENRQHLLEHDESHVPYRQHRQRDWH